MRQVVEFFNERGSNVYIASLDASKAYDRVNHFKLYTTLIKRSIPMFIVNLIVNWYSKLSIVVRWNGHDSASLRVLSSVRQGGVLSPVLFNMYFNCMFNHLRLTDYGCHIENKFIAAIGYADDLLLISAGVVHLQRMLDKCGEVGLKIGIKFNSNKSLCLCIGPCKYESMPVMYINGSPMMWSNKIKYLGILIPAGVRWRVDFTETRCKFFVAVNSILNKCNSTSDLVKLKLMETQCLPILLYSVESLNIKNDELRSINSW